MLVHPFYDLDTSTFSYVVTDEATKSCAIIDPVLDYDPNAGRTTTRSADKIIAFINEQGLKVEWILETHIHADHLTACAYLKEKLGGKTGIGSGIKSVLAYWVPLFNTAVDTPLDGSQFDRLLADGEVFSVGNQQVKVMHTPGHTPACVNYLISDAVFTGDALFMPYVGTGRADFPGGNATTLYRSIQEIYSLPDTTRTFTGHDYPPAGQSPCPESTVGDQKLKNTLIKGDTSEQEFVAVRTKRDQNLPVPKLLLPAIQFNLRGGAAGKVEENGARYLKIPLNRI